MSFAGRTFLYEHKNNRMTRDGSRIFGFDAAGRVCSTTLNGSAAVLSYDFANNMTGCTITGNNHSFINDDKNTRLRKTDNSGSTYYFNAGGQVYSEYDGTGALLADYVYGLDGMVAKIDPYGTYYWYLKDHLGSTRQLDRGDQEVMMKRDYYPYGEDYIEAGSGTDYQFSGKPLDNSMGLYYFGARYYEPGIGRWLVPDYFADKYPDISPYVYCFNNPLRFTDMTGDTVEIDPQLLAPIQKLVKNDKGEWEYRDKNLNEMTDAEKQRYYFQQWWNQKKSEVLALYDIGGKYETTNIIFKLGTKPLGFWENLFNNSGTINKYFGHVAFGEHKTPEIKLYSGTRPVKVEFGIEKLSFYVYFNPNPFKQAMPGTAEHEYRHIQFIFDKINNNQIVPTGAEQHEIIGYH